MKLLRALGGLIAAVGLMTAAAPASAAANYAVKDGNGTLFNLCSVDLTTYEVPCHTLLDAAGVNVFRAEDAAHSSGDSGLEALSVRKDTAASTAGTDGDYAALTTDANGRLHSIVVAASGAFASGSFASGALASGSVASGAIASGAVASGAYASGSIAAGALAAGSGVDGWDLTQGAKADAAWTTGSGSEIALLKAIAGAAIDTTTYSPVNVGLGGSALAANNGAVSAQTLRVTVANDSTGQIIALGNVAHDAADSGAPVKVGGKAASSFPTSVTDADRVDAFYDLSGRAVTAPYSNPENIVSGVITSAITGTTSTSLIAAPASGLRNYVTHIACYNTDADTNTLINVQDGSGGATIYQLFAPFGGGATLTLPVPLKQTTTATALFIAPVTSGASITCSASGFKGP